MIISPADFPVESVIKMHKPERLPRGNNGRRHPVRYRAITTAFDIETSRIPEIDQQIMYVWQWQWGRQFTVVGRTWDELRLLISRIDACLPDHHSIVVLVHNLSYEFQFLRAIHEWEPKEVFAVRPRKVLKATMLGGKLEFRCTYLHSNMSLDAYTHKMRVEHPKLSPKDAMEKYGRSFDYDVVRYPWTELDPLELEYITNDVLGLVEAYEAEMQRDGDTLLTVPMTSTGYVRRDTKRVMRQASADYIRSMQPDLETYVALREAFRGGNTHANRYYANKIIDGPVYSADRSSSYPDVICNCLYPMTPFQRLEDLSHKAIIKLLRAGRQALLLRVAIWDLRPKDPYYGCPYLSRSKCREVTKGTFDNGRILAADYLETTITDIDLDIIMEQYSMSNLVFTAGWSAKYGALPMPMRLLTMQYYKHKTTLKGVEDEESRMLYDKSKALLNAIYGMTVQDPVKQSIIYDEGLWSEDHEDPQKLLEKNAKNNPLCYQWGVWICAWARWRLEQGIRLAGDGFIYCDTDSVKYVGSVDWSGYNRDRIKASTRSGAWADDPKGHRHYMGVFEPEQSYHRFCTMGAKKYAYQYEPAGPTKVTIAGVNKTLGGVELDAHGGLEAFREGFIFRDAGGTESVYNDAPDIKAYSPDGVHTVEVGPNIMIKDSTYTLGITGEYQRLLQDPQLWLAIENQYKEL